MKPRLAMRFARPQSVEISKICAREPTASLSNVGTGVGICERRNVGRALRRVNK
jgi:hypothetical protein